MSGGFGGPALVVDVFAGVVFEQVGASAVESAFFEDADRGGVAGVDFGPDECAFFWFEGGEVEADDGGGISAPPVGLFEVVADIAVFSSAENGENADHFVVTGLGDGEFGVGIALGIGIQDADDIFEGFFFGDGGKVVVSADFGVAEDFVIIFRVAGTDGSKGQRGGIHGVQLGSQRSIYLSRVPDSRQRVRMALACSSNS